MPTVPDGFARGLKGLDPALGVRWHVKRNRYVIVEERGGIEYPVTTVEGPGGRFAPLDNRVLRRLRMMDLLAYGPGRARDLLDHIDREEEAEQERRDREIDEEFGHWAREFAPYLGRGRTFMRPLLNSVPGLPPSKWRARRSGVWSGPPPYVPK